MKKIMILVSCLTISLVATAQKPMNNGYLAAAEAPWVTLTSGTSGNLYAVKFIGADTGYVAGEGGVMLKTTNGGASWSQLFTGTNMPLMSICFTDAMHGFAAGITPSAVYGGFILKTADGGATWTTPLASGSRYGLYDICFPVPDTGYAVGMFGTILKSTNSGATWSLLPVTTSSGLSGVFFTSANTGYAAGDMGTILKTTNGGQSWVSSPSGTTNDLESLSFANATVGYVCGNSGIILKTTNGGFVGIHETLHPAGRLTLFPNPAHDRITVDFAGITDNACLTITDLRGNVVIKQEVGNAGMSVDIRSLATGVYFVLLKTPDSIATGKFVK